MRGITGCGGMRRTATAPACHAWFREPTVAVSLRVGRGGKINERRSRGMIKKVVTLSYLSAAAPPCILTMAIARTNCLATCSRKEAVCGCVLRVCDELRLVSFVCFASTSGGLFFYGCTMELVLTCTRGSKILFEFKARYLNSKI